MAAVILLGWMLVWPWLSERPSVDVKVSSKAEVFTENGEPSKVVYLLVRPIKPLNLIDVKSDDTALYAFEPEASLSLCGRSLDPQFIDSLPSAWGSRYDVRATGIDDGRPLATKVRVYSQGLSLHGQLPPSVIEISYHTGQTRIIEAVLTGARVPQGPGEMLELLAFKLKDQPWPGSSLQLISPLGSTGIVAASFDGEGGGIYSAPDLPVTFSPPVTGDSSLAPAPNTCFEMKLGGASTGPKQGAGILHDPLFGEQSILSAAEDNASNYAQIRSSQQISGRLSVQSSFARIRGTSGYLELNNKQYALLADTSFEVSGDYSLAMNMPDGSVQMSGKATSVRLGQHARDVVGWSHLKEHDDTPEDVKAHINEIYRNVGLEHRSI